MLKTGMLLAMASALTFIAPAEAQTETGRPAFRVPIGGSSSASSGPATYAWMQNVSTCSSACGSGTRTTSYQCQDISSYDFNGSGYGAPESDASCSGTKPSSSSAACTNYSGCSYDWVKPAVSSTILQKTVSGKTYPKGAVVDCSYVNRTFSPYCQRAGSPAVQLPAGDHAFCRNDLPDYAQVAAGDPDALGYDRTGDSETACVAGPRDNEYVYGAWRPWSSTCSLSATRTRDAQCTRKYNGRSLSDADCAGITKDSSETQPILTGCTFNWSTGSYGSYNSTCSDAAVRTRTVVCRRLDGATVADSLCSNDGTKPATSETSPVYTSCSYAWGTPSAWSAWSNGCSASATRTRTVSCTRSNGTVVDDSLCSSSGQKPTLVENAANYDSCTYSARDQGRTACTAQGTQQQYWDCTRSDGQTGYPASYCGKTNPENLSCTPPPPVYTYTAVNRGESACSGGQKNVYWDCTRNDGASGFPASNCGKTNPEVQGCVMPVTYTPRNRGESACSAGQKQVYWDCIGSDGSVAPASSCGKSNPETQSCTMPYSWQWIAGAYGSPSGGCPGSTTRTRAVQCQRNDGYIDSDQFCNAGTRPSSTDVQACPYTWSWSTGGWSGYSSGCSASSTRTRSVYCQRNDGYVDSDQFCSTGARPASSETASVYSSCTYSSEAGTKGACTNGTTVTPLQCRRSDGILVANANCGTSDTRTESCAQTCRWGPVENPTNTTGFNVQTVSNDGASLAASAYRFGSYYINSSYVGKNYSGFYPGDVGSYWFTADYNYARTKTDNSPPRRELWLFCQYGARPTNNGYYCSVMQSRLEVCS